MRRAIGCASKLALAIALLSCGVAAAQDRKLVPAAPEAAGRRLALVVGNDAYPGTSALHNAVADAVAIEQALRGLGFGVDLVRDATQEAFERAVDRFVNNVQAGDVALFYYSGHGLEVRGENYLVPIDFAAQDEVQVKRRAVAAGEIEERLQARGARVRILVLDACRDNPYRAVRSTSGGLAAMAEARGALIAFATAPGKTASDNPGGQNGLFTQELLAILREPGLTVSEVFRRVRERVDRASGARQTPWVADGLIGDFALGPAPASPAASLPEPGNAVPDPEVVAWQAVANTTNLAMLEQFVAAFPNGRYAAAARLKIAALREPARAAQPAPATETPRRATVNDLLADGKAAYARGDYVEAVRCYRQAAESGNAGAMSTVGWLYENGRGVGQDFGQGVSWYRRAAAAGDAEGMFFLGRSYENGRGVPSDDKQALAWYRKAADAGNGAAMAELGERYAGGTGVDADADRSAAWFRMAADAGNARGMARLGTLYQDGVGVPKDLAQAVAWVRKGAEAGDPFGMNYLGTMYERGQGVAKDLDQAIAWYRKAAEGGNSFAMNNLATKYEEGLGVAKDLEQAVAWYRKAAALGHFGARMALERLKR